MERRGVNRQSKKKEKEQIERLTRRATYFIVTIKTECITWAAYFLSDTTTTVNLSCGTRGSSSCKSTGGTGIRLANDDPRDVDGSFADSDHCSKGNEQGKRIHHDGLEGNGLEKCLLITSLLCTIFVLVPCGIIIVQNIFLDLSQCKCSCLRQTGARPINLERMV